MKVEIERTSNGFLVTDKTEYEEEPYSRKTVFQEKNEGDFDGEDLFFKEVLYEIMQLLGLQTVNRGSQKYSTERFVIKKQKRNSIEDEWVDVEDS